MALGCKKDHTSQVFTHVQCDYFEGVFYSASLVNGTIYATGYELTDTGLAKITNSFEFAVEPSSRCRSQNLFGTPDMAQRTEVIYYE